MPFRLATSLAHFCSSGSSADRNLLAQRSMGPSMVTSTVSLALAESFSTSGGILMSWARTNPADASHSASASIILVFVSIIGLLLDLLDPGLIDLVHFRFRELQFATSDAEGQHQALLGGLALGAFASQVIQVDS